MLIGLVAEEGEEEERESHSKVGTLLGPTIIYKLQMPNVNGFLQS